MPKRKCLGCKQYSIPKDAPKNLKWCSDDCMEVVVKLAYDKQRQIRERAFQKQKIAVKKKSQKNDLRIRREAAVRACHKYIHARDAGLPCISCGNSITGVPNAGHYITAGSCMALRFDERNIHLQCIRCNHFLSGNVREYREGLIRKIGLETVLELEGPQPLVDTSADWYSSIESHYKAKLKALK